METDLVEFSGFIPRDAEPKVSKKGTPYFEMTVGWKQLDGEMRWVKTRVFDPSAAAGNFTKGTEVCVKGAVTHDEWTGRDGEKRSGWSCMTRRVTITKGRS
jgi:single-stranded DNA-binding protein